MNFSSASVWMFVCRLAYNFIWLDFLDFWSCRFECWSIGYFIPLISFDSNSRTLQHLISINAILNMV